MSVQSNVNDASADMAAVSEIKTKSQKKRMRKQRQKALADTHSVIISDDNSAGSIKSNPELDLDKVVEQNEVIVRAYTTSIDEKKALRDTNISKIAELNKAFDNIRAEDKRLQIQKRKIQLDGDGRNPDSIYQLQKDLALHQKNIISMQSSRRDVQTELMHKYVIKNKALNIPHDDKALSDFSNRFIENLDKRIQSSEQAIVTIKAQIDKDRSDYSALISFDWEQAHEDIDIQSTNISKEIKDREIQNKQLVKDIHYLEHLFQIAKVKPQYVQYAKTHQIDIQDVLSDYTFPDSIDDNDPDIQLIVACNLHRQHFLLYKNNNGRGHNQYARCYKYREYNGDDECSGYWTGLYGCDCGQTDSNNTWNADDFEPYNLSKFSIESKYPYGFLDAS